MRSHVTSPTGDFGAQEAAMQSYLREGEERAYSLGNRGPLKFNADGKLDKDILSDYSRCGFYIFEGVLLSEELDDIESDVENILERLPM